MVSGFKIALNPSSVVMEMFGIERDVLYNRGRRRQQMQAGSLFCCWAVNELGISRIKLATDLGITQPGVGYAVHRGAQTARKMKYKLVK